MNIVDSQGTIEFDNVLLFRYLSEKEFLNNSVRCNITQQTSNENWVIYSLLYAWIKENPFSLSCVFENEVIRSVSIFVGHLGGTWEELDSEQNSRDFLVLKRLFKGMIGSELNESQFSWGKVELYKDLKNASIPCITVRYF